MTDATPNPLYNLECDPNTGSNRYPAMSERYRLTEELENARYENNLLAQKCREMEKERDDAWLKLGRIYNEIDCRIEHGADSNGHLEAIYNLFKENSNV